LLCPNRSKTGQLGVFMHFRCRIAFSGVIPLKTDPARCELWVKSKGMAAECLDIVSRRITHLVVRGPGSRSVLVLYPPCMLGTLYHSLCFHAQVLFVPPSPLPPDPTPSSPRSHTHLAFPLDAMSACSPVPTSASALHGRHAHVRDALQARAAGSEKCKQAAQLPGVMVVQVKMTHPSTHGLLPSTYIHARDSSKLVR